VTSLSLSWLRRERRARAAAAAVIRVKTLASMDDALQELPATALQQTFCGARVGLEVALRIARAVCAVLGRPLGFEPRPQVG
jgi:hypothetical protein